MEKKKEKKEEEKQDGPIKETPKGDFLIFQHS